MKEKILIVEDDPVHMRLIEMTLKVKDYTLLKAASGEEALELAARDKPDLVIMDIHLPKMNGFEVTRKLRENPAFSHTPIIALTANAMKEDIERVIASGGDAYSTKPINTRELPEVIAEMLSGQK